ncbi:MFS transporter [Oscillatoria sp. CS-180]|uniref:MFS transporter n=1 Tax=Oscillatoria sp. CS-180 TaxID=3021720 RepID=UPI00232DE3F8|nr:MFS transporter [Oscillatoria sp. CS-180]MDB9528774.1 MFS transporter [Oscillatoria sp. CS-180]
MENLNLLSQPFNQLRTWLPPLRREIWILAVGQLMLFIGQGFTLVYASIYFVNQLGFSPTQVGLAQGCVGVSGILGRFLAGNALNSAWLGRRGTLILSAVIAALGSWLLAFATTFPLLVAGNLCLGLGISLYWPATLTITTDLTDPQYRAEAMALTRLADNLGLGVGALIAGQYIAVSGNYSTLFICKGIAYLIFGVVIFMTIEETRQEISDSQHPLSYWGQAFRDRPFVIFLIANLFFAIYGAQSNSTLPLYLANFVPGGDAESGFSERFISYFFVWHVVLKILLQLPLTRLFRARSHSTLLLGSLVIWCSGFVLVWLTSALPQSALLSIIGAFALLAIAEVVYSPSSSALTGDLAPTALRGIYFSLESQCWAIGFLVGPIVGGWALDHPAAVGADLWLYLVVSSVAAGVLLLQLQRAMPDDMNA